MVSLFDRFVRCPKCGAEEPDFEIIVRLRIRHEPRTVPMAYYCNQCGRGVRMDRMVPPLWVMEDEAYPRQALVKALADCFLNSPVPVEDENSEIEVDGWPVYLDKNQDED